MKQSLSQYEEKIIDAHIEKEKEEEDEPDITAQYLNKDWRQC